MLPSSRCSPSSHQFQCKVSLPAPADCRSLGHVTSRSDGSHYGDPNLELAQQHASVATRLCISSSTLSVVGIEYGVRGVARDFRLSDLYCKMLLLCRFRIFVLLIFLFINFNRYYYLFIIIIVTIFVVASSSRSGASSPPSPPAAPTLYFPSSANVPPALCVVSAGVWTTRMRMIAMHMAAARHVAASRARCTRSALGKGSTFSTLKLISCFNDSQHLPDTVATATTNHPSHIRLQRRACCFSVRRGMMSAIMMTMMIVPSISSVMIGEMMMMMTITR